MPNDHKKDLFPDYVGRIIAQIFIILILLIVVGMAAYTIKEIWSSVL